MGVGYQKEIDNNPQSQVAPPFRFFLTEHLQEGILLASAIEKGDSEIELAPGHGFVGRASYAHEVFVLWYGDRYIQARVESVADDTITIESPAPFAVPMGDETIIRGNIGMAVDGSSTPRVFKFDMNGASIPIDMATAIIKMYHGATAADDGRFGGDTGIVNRTQGLLLQREGDALAYNFGNYCNNGDFRDSGAKVEYIDSAPAGSNGTIVTWSLIDVFTNEQRFDPRVNDQFIATVRGDISGNSDVHFMLLGSYTRGE